MRRLAVALACLVPLGAALPAMAADALPDEVEYQLIYMREEEKLAHDVYLLFDGLYGGTTPGAQVFQRITLSEQRHTDAVAQLLEAYGVEDTVADAAPGEFTIPELQDLYVTLVAVGEAGLTEGAFQALHLSHADTERVIRDPRVDFVAFTGSVAGGHAVQRAAADRFIGTGLELGGCDPAYVRHDANLAHAIENLVDGAYFNSGQSCCGVQRVYVHERLHDAFVEGWVDLTRKYVLGSPVDADTTLGPVVRTAAADEIRRQIAASVAAGARAVIDEKAFGASRAGTPYLAPQVLLGVDNSMPVMREEIFGPVAGIMKVASDEEAVRLMNDSAFGLTAAIWTADEEAALAIGDRVQTGTWFMNRCDYLDPALAWVGVKDSGRGCTLSAIGYEHLTRPKSFHLRVQT